MYLCYEQVPKKFGLTFKEVQFNALDYLLLNVPLLFSKKILIFPRKNLGKPLFLQFPFANAKMIFDFLRAEKNKNK